MPLLGSKQAFVDPYFKHDGKMVDSSILRRCPQSSEL